MSSYPLIKVANTFAPVPPADKLLAHLSPDLMTKRSTWVDMRSLGGSVEIIGEDYDDEEWDVDWRGPVWDEVFGA